MKKLIACPKEFGNTHKVCGYVSSNSDIELKVVSTKTTKYFLPYYDVIILASGVYVNHVHKNIIDRLIVLKKTLSIRIQNFTYF